jgi:hypothetical protein
MTYQGGPLPTREQFSSQVNRTFRASVPDAAEFELTLIEFREITDDDFQETFSLLFLAPADFAANQGTYQMENDEMGSLDIFLVPIKRDDKGIYFEAIFNRLKNKGAVGGHS